MFDKSIKRSEKLARSNDNVGFAEGNVPRIDETRRYPSGKFDRWNDAGKLPESGSFVTGRLPRIAYLSFAPCVVKGLSTRYGGTDNVDGYTFYALSFSFSLLSFFFWLCLCSVRSFNQAGVIEHSIVHSKFKIPRTYLDICWNIWRRWEYLMLRNEKRNEETRKLFSQSSTNWLLPSIEEF